MMKTKILQTKTKTGKRRLEFLLNIHSKLHCEHLTDTLTDTYSLFSIYILMLFIFEVHFAAVTTQIFLSQIS